MNRLFKFSLVATVAALLTASHSAKAADAVPSPTDVSGSWELHINFPGRPPQDTVLKLEKAGDKYVGALTGNMGRANPVRDVEYKDGNLTFKVTFERQGQKAEILYAVKVTGEKLKGKMTITGRNISLDIDGNRVKPTSPVVGVWKINFVLESGQKLQASANLKQSGEMYRGDYIGITGKQSRVKDVKFKDGELSFDAPDRADDEDLTFHFAGKVNGDTLKGTVTWPVAGGQKKSLKFEALKSRSLAADVSGTWKLKFTIKNGPTFEPTVKLTQTGGAVTGTYTGEQGDTPISEAIVLGEELTFEVFRQKDGKSYRLRYQGKVNGDTFKGNVDYSFDGISGFYDFEGKRIAPGATAKP